MENNIFYSKFRVHFSRWRKITRLSLRSTTALPTGNLQSECWNNCALCFCQWGQIFSLWETSQTLFWASFGLIDLDNFELSGIKEFTRFWGLIMFGRSPSSTSSSCSTCSSPWWTTRTSSSQSARWVNNLSKVAKGKLSPTKVLTLNIKMFCRITSQNWMSHFRPLGEVFIYIIFGRISFSQFCFSS